MFRKITFLTLILLSFFCANAFSLARPGVEFKIFQFPPDKIPVIDGKIDDWSIFPESYSIGTDQLSDTVSGIGTNIDRNDLDVKVKVGWVKEMNRLYFLYEASDDYWEFDSDSLKNDIFEVVVDGDLSGGPLIKQMNPNLNPDKPDQKLNIDEFHFTFHGVHAQNYHIFTPPGNKDWCMVWGCPQWIKDLPYANKAYSYNFQQGKKGKLTLEFFITPFDFAMYDRPQRSVESKLEENKLIGLSWSILDYDGKDKYDGFYNLSHITTMYGNASDLVLFRLMPLDAKFLKPVQAHWTFKVVDMDRRIVAFHDDSVGKITKWSWDFGEGLTSTEQNPVITFKTPGEKTVTLTVESAAGKSKFTRVWDVVLK